MPAWQVSSTLMALVLLFSLVVLTSNMSVLQTMAAGGDQAYSTLEAVPHQIHQPSRRKWILFVGAVGLIAVLAAVLGEVLGPRNTSSATVSPNRLSNSSFMSPSARPPQRKIAALSFAFNSVNNTRIYFQDNMGQIMEAANSAANSTWSIRRIGIGGKNGSAIAAAVSRPGFPLVSQVFPMSVASC